MNAQFEVGQSFKYYDDWLEKTMTITVTKISESRKTIWFVKVGTENFIYCKRISIIIEEGIVNEYIKLSKSCHIYANSAEKIKKTTQEKTISKEEQAEIKSLVKHYNTATENRNEALNKKLNQNQIDTYQDDVNYWYKKLCESSKLSRKHDELITRLITIEEVGKIQAIETTAIPNTLEDFFQQATKPLTDYTIEQAATCRKGFVRASYNDLVGILGQPEKNDDLFTFKGEVDGINFTIETLLDINYREVVYEWNIHLSKHLSEGLQSVARLLCNLNVFDELQRPIFPNAHKENVIQNLEKYYGLPKVSRLLIRKLIQANGMVSIVHDTNGIIVIPTNDYEHAYIIETFLKKDDAVNFCKQIGFNYITTMKGFVIASYDDLQNLFGEPEIKDNVISFKGEVDGLKLQIGTKHAHEVDKKVDYEWSIWLPVYGNDDNLQKVANLLCSENKKYTKFSVFDNKNNPVFFKKDFGEILQTMPLSFIGKEGHESAKSIQKFFEIYANPIAYK